MKNIIGKLWEKLEKSSKKFVTIVVTAWMLAGCGWWGSRWWGNLNECWNWQDVKKSAPIKVVDGPVKNADVFLVLSDGTEIKIWKTDNEGSVKLDENKLDGIDWKIIIKVIWWSDENGSINGEFYLPAITKEQLQSFIENNETININPTTTYFYKIIKETWWTLHEALQKYNIEDLYKDGKLDAADLAKYTYTWTYKGIVSQDPNDDGISFEKAIRDGDEWAFQDDIKALQNKENTHINTFIVNNSNVSFGYGLNVSFNVSDENGLKNVVLILQDAEWNEYVIDKYNANSSNFNGKLALKPVLAPDGVMPNDLLNDKNELALQPWKYTLKLTAEWKQGDFDTNNFVEQTIDLNILNKLQASTSATNITEWDSINLSVEWIASWYEDAFDITWYDENNNEVWTGANLEDFVPNAWNHTYHAVVKENGNIVAETENVSIEVKVLYNASWRQLPDLSNAPYLDTEENTIIEDLTSYVDNLPDWSTFKVKGISWPRAEYFYIDWNSLKRKPGDVDDWSWDNTIELTIIYPDGSIWPSQQMVVHINND